MLRHPLRLCFWLATTVAFVMAVLPHPPQLPGAPTDKIQHILAFAVLTVLGSAAYPRTHPVALIIGLAAFGGLIEAVQAIPALHRTSDVRDWLADVASVLIALGIILTLGRVGVRLADVKRDKSAPHRW